MTYKDENGNVWLETCRRQPPESIALTTLDTPTRPDPPTPLVGPNGHSNLSLASDFPGCWQRMGVCLGVYVRLPATEGMPYETEPVFMAGLKRNVTAADLEGAIKFLGVLRDKLLR